jgi:surfeit locus 1 family protein
MPPPVKHRAFSPPFAATLAVLLLMPVLAGLGCWQGARAREKAHLLDEAAAGQAAAPTELASSESLESLAGWRPLRVQGVFLAERQGLLDNQVRDGRVGYDILTPLRVNGRDELLLVDRGWLPRGPRREDLPQWSTPDGLVSLTGTLHVPVDVPLVSGTVSDVFGGAWVVSEIDLPLLGRQLGAPLARRVLRLDPASEHGFRRDWPVVGMTPQRHYGYAVQWFGLALALLVLYVVAGVRRARAAQVSE